MSSYETLLTLSESKYKIIPQTVARVHIKKYWNFQRDTTKQDTLFVRAHMKQYWHFWRVTTKQNYTHFSELVAHNTFPRSNYKIKLYTIWEFILNNNGTSTVITKQYYKVILFYKFLSNKNWHFQRVTSKYYWLSTEDAPENTSFSLKVKLILNIYWLE